MNTTTAQLFLGLLGVATCVLLWLGGKWWWADRQWRKTQTPSRIAPTPPQPEGDADTLNDPLAEQNAVATPATNAAPEAPADTGDPGEWASPPLRLAEEPAPSLLDARIDCIARLECDEPQSCALITHHLPSTRRVGSKPWQIQGVRPFTQETIERGETPEHHEPLQPQHRYRIVEVGLQRVNRHGAMNDVEYSEFAALVQHLAAAMNASTHMPEMVSEVQRAKALEHFVVNHNLCLSLKLCAIKASWSHAYVQYQALQAGFVAGTMPGHWVMGPSASESITLSIDSHTALASADHPEPIHQMVLSLEVPQLSQDWQPFKRMSEVALMLCASMGAQIRDEAGRVVEAAALARTEAELESVYASLAQAGLAAGSPLAKRLFA